MTWKRNNLTPIPTPISTGDALPGYTRYKKGELVIGLSLKWKKGGNHSHLMRGPTSSLDTVGRCPTSNLHGATATESPSKF